MTRLSQFRLAASRSFCDRSDHEYLFNKDENPCNQGPETKAQGPSSSTAIGSPACTARLQKAQKVKFKLIWSHLCRPNTHMTLPLAMAGVTSAPRLQRVDPVFRSPLRRGLVLVHKPLQERPPCQRLLGDRLCSKPIQSCGPRVHGNRASS